MVEMDLVGVRVELPSNTPIALLRERSGARRVLPIFIGGPEATAIAFALEEVVTPRPMTHDLIRNLLDELGVSMESIVVTELRDRTFYAEIELHASDGVHRVSSRPSDAIALAVRVGIPIYAAESVLDEAGFEAEDEADADAEPEEQAEEVVEQFREFIDNVTPDDFGS
ncbi:bifunctional nuclease family protein [Iamia sp.]|uniref:bifunctional nuclease family protein n=1 Tax=Iamia sp. TaxID=2722710 RepID=UPI002C41E8B7|nr:bifunctional nuclease family protein [Iamia sp.]HXH57220.1 bifunctional nuclease family protein [Iamia sp.]